MTMKKIFNIISIIAVVASCFAASSCTESSSSKNATPVVRYIRSCNPTLAQKLLTEVSMGSTVAIIGENLADVNEVLFNDQACKLNPTLITNTSIICTVPSTMPSEVTGKVYLNTSTGKTCEYDFGVIIPSPSITSISCEWGVPGTEVSIFGNYFFAKEDGSVDVVFPGNAVAEVVSVSDTEVRVVVPESATISGNLSMTSAYGTSKSSFTWRNTEGRFIDFEETSWNWWGYSSFESDDPVDGQYAHLSGSTGSWAWPDGKLWILWFNNNGTALVSEGEVSDYSLVFEYKINQWDSTVPMNIVFGASNDVYGVDGNEAQYHWYAADSDNIWGEWATKTISLTDFNTDKGETTTERYIASVKDLFNFFMMPFGDGTTGDMDLYIDNVRLVNTAE